MATPSSILGKEIPWTQEPGRLQSITKRLYTSELLSTLWASVSLNTASLLPDPFYVCLHTQSDYTVNYVVESILCQKQWFLFLYLLFVLCISVFSLDLLLFFICHLACLAFFLFSDPHLQIFISRTINLSVKNFCIEILFIFKFWHLVPKHL